MKVPSTLEELAELTSPSWHDVLTGGGVTADDIAAAQEDPDGPTARSLAHLWFRSNYDTDSGEQSLVRVDQAGFWYRFDELKAASFVYWPWFVLPWHWRMRNLLSARLKIPRTAIVVVWLVLIVLVLFGS
jgi:hypothetical protein